MAVWQFKVELIPRSWLSAGLDLASLYPEGSFDGSTAWAGYADAEALEKEIDSTLPRRQSWHADLIAWGDEESNDIQLWREEGRIDSVGVRIDLRNPSAEFLASVINVAKKFELSLLVRETKQILGPDVEKLAAAAGESRAAAFVRDPRGFLSRLGAES